MNFKTRWNITIGTYGTRLHGGPRPTVERTQNGRGDSHLVDDPVRERIARSAMRDVPVLLTPEQRIYIESIIPEICKRGGWDFIECGAQPDHMHIVLDIDPAIHGKQARKWLKRWTSEALSERWPQPSDRVGGFIWWAEGGSTRPVRGHEYRGVVIDYVNKQRATTSKRPEPIDPF